MKGKVFLIRNVASNMYGGGETYQLKLARLLKESDFQPYIVSASRKLLKTARIDGFETIKSPYLKRQNWSGWRNILLPVYYMKMMKLRKWYKGVFEKYQPQVINIQSRDDWIAATPVAKKMGIRVLWTDHMDFRSWVLKNVNKWYKNLIGKWVLRNARKADKIIMISDYERKYFEKVVAPRKFKNLVTIKNGATDEYEDFKKIESKKENIIYLGRVVDYKGIKELIEAFQIVNQQYSQIRLNIYGDGEDLATYQKLAGSNSQIVFHGQTDEPLKKIAENEIFVLPSYREGLSLSLLDAAMMEKVIIASDVDGNPEVVVNQKTGLLVPAKNAVKLSEALMWVLTNKKEAGQMARAARKHYEENFNFETIFLEKMLPLYNVNEEEK